MNLAAKVGKRIKEFRTKKGITQEELAYQTGLHQANIYLLENGKRRFNSEQIEKISQVLGVPVISFFEEKFEIKSDEMLDDSKLLNCISQMQSSKKIILFSFIEYLQDSGDDIDFETIKKAVELIKQIKQNQ